MKHYVTRLVVIILALVCVVTIWTVRDSTKVSATNSWEQVDQNSFGSTNNIRLTRFHQFKNKLYAINQSCDGDNCASQVWSTADGQSWTRSTDFPNIVSTALYNDIEVFGDYLYVAQSNGGPDRAFLYRSLDGVSWTAANDGGFGDDNNIRITRIIVFNGYLYAFTANEVSGNQVWRSANGTNWAQIGNGVVTIAANWGTNSTVVFNGKLYVACANDSGTRIYATANGTDWTQVNTSGFGADYWGVFALAVFKGNIYAAAVNNSAAAFFRSGNGTDWNQITVTGVDFSNIDFSEMGLGLLVNDTAVVNNLFYLGQPMFNGTNGAKPLSSSDGLAWSAASENGMGTVNNYFIHTITLFKNYIYVGFDNTGPRAFSIKHRLRDYFINQVYAAGNNAGFQIWRTAITPLSISPETLVNGTVGTSYSQALSAVSGTSPYTFSATGLPSGLTISTSGVITGTPTVAGTSSVVVTLGDDGNPAQTASRTYTLTVSNPLPRTGVNLLLYRSILLGGALCIAICAIGLLKISRGA